MTRSKNKKKEDYSQVDSLLPSLTVEQVLSRGDEAARLLNEQIFSTAVGQTMINIQNDWIGTAPHEQQKREGMYLQVRALHMVLDELQGMLQATQGINLESHKQEEINPKFQ